MNAAASPSLSIIVPVLNEEATITTCLEKLRRFQKHGVEIIAVDGGSSDATVRLARSVADQVLAAPRGRGSQMNHGASHASGEILLFLHADTILPADADQRIRDAMMRGRLWGHFDIRIDGHSRLFRVIAWAMNRRSRLTRIATGDQAVFVARVVFDAVGGFPDIPLMEDIVLSSRLRRFSAPEVIPAAVTTSGRRWEKHGILKTILKMWWLRLRFFLGANPARLALEYGYAPR